MTNEFRHTFAISAYGESPHIEECIQSLKQQSVPSKVILATSTPSPFLEGLCEKYHIPYFVRNGQSGLANDWNFALQSADADFVTIAHQDDLYHPRYLEMVEEYRSRAKTPIIFFTDYDELRGSKTIANNRLLNTKRRINRLVKPRAFWPSRFMRRRALSVGCAICCPSVCINKKRFPNFRFDEHFSCDLDWDAWSRLAEERGEFVYIPEIMMSHRIHEASETTRLLENGVRFREDEQILMRYWPKWIARRIMKKYKESAKSNEEDMP
ncbi:MAG: glycosyltransferase family 2 protein [Christensenellaceae bacterium]|jgi:glycosyltransferase involved in cell wall biosynthesis